MNKAIWILLLVPLLGVEAWAEQTCDVSRHALSAPTERFINNEDGTVTDTVTDLVWMRCAVGQEWSGETCQGSPARYTLQDASAAAEQVNQQGDYFFNDWRLPSLPELASISERECQDPRINLDVFPNTPAAMFWSRTARPGMGEGGPVYGLSFGAAGAGPVPREQPNHVRLVRYGG